MKKDSFSNWIIKELGREVKEDYSYESIKDLPLEKLGLDSLELLDLVLKIEDYFQIEIPAEGFDGITKLDQIRDLIFTKSSLNS